MPRGSPGSFGQEADEYGIYQSQTRKLSSSQPPDTPQTSRQVAPKGKVGPTQVNMPMPCFWAVLSTKNLQFLQVYPSWTDTRLHLTGSKFQDHVPPENSSTILTNVQASLAEKSLNGFYVRCGFKVPQGYANVESLFVPLHEHLSLVIVHALDPLHLCGLKTWPLEISKEEVKSLRNCLDQRPDDEKAPLMPKGNGRPAAIPRPPGWLSRTLFVLDHHSMRPLVMDPVPRAEAFTGLPWQRMMHHPFDAADWRRYQKQIITQGDHPIQVRFSVHHEQPLYMHTPLSHTTRVRQTQEPQIPLGHLEEVFDHVWTEALVLPVGPITLAIVQFAQPDTDWHGSTLYKKETQPTRAAPAENRHVRVVEKAPVRPASSEGRPSRVEPRPPRPPVRQTVSESGIPKSRPGPSDVPSMSSGGRSSETMVVPHSPGGFKGPCMKCGATDTPEWRRGPTGRKELCNACGLRYARLQKKERGMDFDDDDSYKKRRIESDSESDKAYIPEQGADHPAADYPSAPADYPDYQNMMYMPPQNYNYQYYYPPNYPPPVWPGMPPAGMPPIPPPGIMVPSPNPPPMALHPRPVYMPYDYAASQAATSRDEDNLDQD